MPKKLRTQTELREAQRKRDERWKREFASWFKDHVAKRVTCSATDSDLKVDVLDWRAPESSHFAIRYVCEGDKLYVSGDLGEAVYRVYSRSSLEWWASTSIDYFSSKCTASEHGRQYKSWDEEEGRISIESQFDYEDGESDDDGEETEGDKAQAKFKRFVSEGGYSALETEQEWMEWLRLHGSEFWTDAWELGDYGRRVDPRCQSHLVGLKLAIAQLAAKAAA